jgi:hypothetical protein
MSPSNVTSPISLDSPSPRTTTDAIIQFVHRLLTMDELKIRITAR